MESKEEDEDGLAALIGHIDEEEATLKNSVPVHVDLKDVVRVPLRGSSVNNRTRFQNPIFKTLKDSDQSQEAICGFAITERFTSIPRVASHFGEERNMVYLRDLAFVTEYSENTDDFTRFATIGVVSDVSSVQTNTKTTLPYRTWIVSDLKGNDLKVFFFGEAFKQVSQKVPKGSVVVLLDPKLNFRYMNDANNGATTSQLTLGISKAAQIILVGQSLNFALCRVGQCNRACDKSISPYCPSHAREQLRIVAANRMNLNSSGGSFMKEMSELLPKTRQEARRMIQGRFDEEIEQDTTRPISAADKVIPEKKIDARAFMNDIMSQSSRGLSAGKLKVAQALKLTDAMKHKPLVFIPPAPIATETRRPTASRPLGSGLAALRTKGPLLDKPKSKKDFKVPNYFAMLNEEDRAKVTGAKRIRPIPDLNFSPS